MDIAATSEQGVRTALPAWHAAVWCLSESLLVRAAHHEALVRTAAKLRQAADEMLAPSDRDAAARWQRCMHAAIDVADVASSIKHRLLNSGEAQRASDASPSMQHPLQQWQDVIECADLIASAAARMAQACSSRPNDSAATDAVTQDAMRALVRCARLSLHTQHADSAIVRAFHGAHTEGGNAPIDFAPSQS